MKVLELFSGTACMANTFAKRGHEIFTIDWDEKFDASWHTDISTITTDDILERFGVPDVVWIGTDCTTYSVAAISKHRKKNPVTKNLDPISEHAKFCDNMNLHVKEIIAELLKLNPKLIYFWENPRGALRKMIWMQDMPRYTITYCKYGSFRMKPTDIWSNHEDPQFLPPCKNGDPCHESAPRGSKSGTQRLKGAVERSMYPQKLCFSHISTMWSHNFCG